MADEGMHKSGVELGIDASAAEQGAQQYNAAIQGIRDAIARLGEAAVSSSMVIKDAAHGQERAVDSLSHKYLSAEEIVHRLGEITKNAWQQAEEAATRASGGLEESTESITEGGTAAQQAAELIKSLGDAKTRVAETAKQLGVDIESSNDKIARSAEAVVQAYISEEAAKQRLVDAEEKVKNASEVTQTMVNQLRNAHDQLARRIIGTTRAKRAYRQATEGASRVTGAAQRHTLQFTSSMGALQARIKAVVTEAGVKGTASIKAFGMAFKTASGPLIIFIALLGALVGAGAVAVKTLGLIVNVFKKLLSPIRAAIDKVRKFVRQVSAIAIGILLRDTIRSLVREIRNLAVAAFDAAVAFQTLQIRMEGLVARFIRQEQAGISVAESFRAAAGDARNLLGWMQQLALTKPISFEHVSDAMSMSMALGFNVDQTRALTLAVGNFVAGMGLTSEHMQRIIWNFGQMKTAQKVTGTELRDLVRGSFFPMLDVLTEAADMLGISADRFQEFRKAASEGAIDVDTFFEAFSRVVESHFPNAMERLNRTIQGVITRFRNFVNIVIGLDILGPILERIAERGSAALDRLVDSGRQTTQMIGQALLRSVDMVWFSIKTSLIPALKDLADALGLPEFSARNLIYTMALMSALIMRIVRETSLLITRIANRIREVISAIQGGAFEWGFNIIGNLARGMMAAVTWVIKAINAVSRAIASWLKPGSPPKALPKLPQWGAAAMTEYLRGFALADFTVLRAIQAPIRDALSMFVDLGEMTKTAMATIYAELSKEIAEAISTGIFAEDLFARIAAQTGEFGEEIALLARRQIELAGAIKEVEMWERRVADARKREERAGIKVNKMIREYNEMLRRGASAQVLKNMRERINEQNRARHAAKAERAEAEEQLDIAREQLAVFEEIAKSQQALVDQLIEITKLFIEAEKGAKGVSDVVPDDWPDWDPELPPVEPLPDPAEWLDELDKMFAQAIKAANDFVDDLSESLSGIRKSIEEDLLDPIVGTLENIKKAWEGITGWEGWEIIKKAFTAIYSFIAGEAEYWSKEATKWWEEHGWAFESILNTLWEFVTGKTAEEMEEQIRLHRESNKEIEQIWMKHYPSISKFIADWWEDLRHNTAQWMHTYGYAWQAIAYFMRGEWGNALDAMNKIYDLEWGRITTRTEEGGQENAEAAYSAGARTSLEFDRGISGIGESLPGAIKESGERSWGEFYSSMQMIGETAKDTTKEIDEEFRSALKSIRGEVSLFKDDIERDFGLLRDRVVRRSIVPEMMTDIYNTIKRGFGDTTKEQVRWTRDFLDKMSELARNVTRIFANTDWSEVGRSIIDGIADSITGGAKRVVDAITDVVKEAVRAAKDYLGISSRSRLFMGIGRDIMMGLEKGILVRFNYPVEQLAVLASRLTTAARAASGPISAMPLMASQPSVNVNLGGVSIHNEMDQQIFEARVVGAVKRALRR